MAKVTMAVWQRAAMRAEELAAKSQTYTYGGRSDANAVWAAGRGMPTYKMYAEEGAIAVVIAEWRRPEGHSDDDSSKGGYHLLPDGNTVRAAVHASVFRGADGVLTLGRWIGEDGAVRSGSVKVAETVRDW